MIDNEGIACVPAHHCARCGAQGEFVHTNLRDRLFGVAGTWNIRRCAVRRCGMGWLDPRPRHDEFYKLYATYYTHAGATVERAPESSFRTGGRKAALKRVLATLMPWRRDQLQTDLCHLQGTRPGKLLEVGCGDGSFLAAATAQGWEARGIDLDEKAIAAAKRLPGVQAEVHDLNGAAYADAMFDAVVMNNVIEHLPNPAEVFAECQRVLRPGGRLVMITPNLDALGHGVFGPDWRGLEIPRHLFLFTARALWHFAKEAGFERACAFSPLGHAGTPFICELSQEIAIRSGRRAPGIHPAVLGMSSSLLALFGISRGEWVVLVAEK